MGLVTIFHSDPSHDITNVVLTFPGPETRDCPTAAHEDAETHDTDFSSSALPVVGLVTLDHDVPSHDITDAESKSLPTATHDDAETHETELSLLYPSSPALRPGTTENDDPSQDITNGLKPGLAVAPTATHEDADTHDTELSLLPEY